MQLLLHSNTLFQSELNILMIAIGAFISSNVIPLEKGLTSISSQNVEIKIGSPEQIHPSSPMISFVVFGLPSSHGVPLAIGKLGSVSYTHLTLPTICSV